MVHEAKENTQIQLCILIVLDEGPICPRCTSFCKKLQGLKVPFDIYSCDFCEILGSQKNLVQWGKGPKSTMSEGEVLWVRGRGLAWFTDPAEVKEHKFQSTIVWPNSKTRNPKTPIPKHWLHNRNVLASPFINLYFIYHWGPHGNKTIY